MTGGRNDIPACLRYTALLPRTMGLSGQPAWSLHIVSYAVGAGRSPRVAASSELTDLRVQLVHVKPIDRRGRKSNFLHCASSSEGGGRRLRAWRSFYFVCHQAARRPCFPACACTWGAHATVIRALSLPGVPTSWESVSDAASRSGRGTWWTRCAHLAEGKLGQ